MAAAERGLVIVMALGIVGISLRTILGNERTGLGSVLYVNMNNESKWNKILGVSRPPRNLF
ncbi:hypothetical protein KEJ49_02815 [Candidatus Bathyarchaeota archaeon]|nr:hypothetical protein [Candidatus Bathyarchaeota archaeon]